MADFNSDNTPREFTEALGTHRTSSNRQHIPSDEIGADALGISTRAGGLWQKRSEVEAIGESPATGFTNSETLDISEKFTKTTVVSEHIKPCSSPRSHSSNHTLATGWYSRALDTCSDHWVLELLSCGMAVACFVAIIAILDMYQDRPLPSSPDAISINSWISIFTAIMKAAVMLPVAEGT